MASFESERGGDRPRIGAHVSTAGHIDIAVENAKKINAEAVQIFGAAPQQWRRKEHSSAHVVRFRENAIVENIGPNFIHGIYLTNLGTADNQHLKQGIESLTADMRLGSALGIRGVIFHVGSHLGVGVEAVRSQIAAAMREVLAESPDDILLCIENSAGAGNSIGSSFTEIGAIINDVNSDRMGVCLDTCHAFSADYDLTSMEGISTAMTEFDREIGLERLVAIHANDSKTPSGSGKDRHENIGWGSIGTEGFRGLLEHPALREAAWFLEVPGFKGGGPDILNIKILRALRDDGKLPRIPKQKSFAAHKSAKKKNTSKSRAKKVQDSRKLVSTKFTNRTKRRTKSKN